MCTSHHDNMMQDRNFVIMKFIGKRMHFANRLQSVMLKHLYIRDLCRCPQSVLHIKMWLFQIEAFC